MPEDAELEALSEEARHRLEALREFADLGAGFRLALRDLEIRGAGELLGARQHGFINAVGADFYAQLLEEEMSRLKGRAGEGEEPPARLDIAVPAYIPADYLPDEMTRLEFYKRMLKSAEAKDAGILREIEELCGPAPAPVRTLFRLLGLRAEASRAGVRSVTQRGGRVEVFFGPRARVGPESLSLWERAYGGRLRFLRSSEGDGLSAELGDKPPLEWLEGFLSGLVGAPAKK